MDILAVFVALVFLVSDGFILIVTLATKRPLRFRLRTLFVAITVAALQLGAVMWMNHQYYRQLRDVRAVLAEHPEIERIWLGTNDDVELEVEQVYFSIQGQPELTFYSGGIDTRSKDEFRSRLDHALKERQPVVRPDDLPEYRIR